MGPSCLPRDKWSLIYLLLSSTALQRARKWLKDLVYFRQMVLIKCGKKVTEKFIAFVGPWMFKRARAQIRAPTDEHIPTQRERRDRGRDKRERKGKRERERERETEIGERDRQTEKEGERGGRERERETQNFITQN